MNRTILSEVNGWTPLIDEIVQAHGVVTAAVFGRMWRYCQMEKGVCCASIETIADELNISRMTVIRHIETLVADDYLIDLTPDVRNKPHDYADSGKVEMKSSISAVSKGTRGIPKSDTSNDRGIPNSDTRYNYLIHPGIPNSDLKIVLKKEEERIVPPKNPSPVFPAPALSLKRKSSLYAIEDFKIPKEMIGVVEVTAEEQPVEDDGPTYVNVGAEFSAGKRQRPKYMQPSNNFQRLVLAATHQKYFKNKHEQSDVLQIQRLMEAAENKMLLSPGEQPVMMCEAYVTRLIVWMYQKNNGRITIGIQQWIAGLNNEANFTDFLRDWNKNKKDGKHGRTDSDYEASANLGNWGNGPDRSQPD